MGRTKSDKKFEIYSKIVSLMELRITKDLKPSVPLREEVARDSYDAAEIYLQVFDKKQAIVGQRETRSSSDKINAMVQFNNARVLYPGKRRGNDTEFLAFSRKHKDFLKIAPTLENLIKRQIEHKNYQKNFTQEFIPMWPNFQTWISQRRWEEYIPDVPIKKNNLEVPI